MPKAELLHFEHCDYRPSRATSKGDEPKRRNHQNPESQAQRGRPAAGLYPEKSRHELARKIGCSVQYLSRVLLGRHPVKGFSLMLDLADALEISPRKLEADLKSACARGHAKHGT